METLRDIGVMVLSMALLATSDAFIKLASRHAPVGEIMLLLSVGGTLLFMLVSTLRGVPLRLRDAISPKVMLRNAFEIVGAIGMLVGLSKIPLSLMAAILQAAPLVVTLGAAIFLREPVGWRRWAAIAVGMTGMLMVVRPFGADFSGWELFAVFGVIGLAARDLVTRVIPPEMPALAISTFGFASVMPVGLLMTLLSDAPVSTHPMVFVYMGCAVVVTTGGYLAVTAAMRMAPVSSVAPFRYTRLVFTTGLGMAVFSERPDGWTLAGAALILSAGLYTFLRERRLARNASLAVLEP